MKKIICIFVITIMITLSVFNCYAVSASYVDFGKTRLASAMMLDASVDTLLIKYTDNIGVKYVMITSDYTINMSKRYRVPDNDIFFGQSVEHIGFTPSLGYCAGFYIYTSTDGMSFNFTSLVNSGTWDIPTRYFSTARTYASKNFLINGTIVVPINPIPTLVQIVTFFNETPTNELEDIKVSSNNESWIESLLNLPSSIGSFFNILKDWLVTNATNVINGINNASGGFFSSLGTTVLTAKDNVLSGISTFFSTIGNTVIDSKNGILTGITTTFNSSIDNILTLADRLNPTSPNFFIKTIGDNTLAFFYLFNKDNPNNLFKILFVLPNGYLENKINSSTETFRGHFGFVADTADIMSNFTTRFLAMNSQTPTLTFPEIREPFYNYKLINSTPVSFAFLNSGNWYILHQFYYVLVDLILIISLSAFGISTFNKIVK